ncbi:MAG: alpha/beta hydrolase [Thalassospira sp.]|uniref:alpha/beta hydrolase n=1 Tax=Thalassospira sp. TaxID=1912094 RepID=UPI0032ED33EE
MFKRDAFVTNHLGQITAGLLLCAVAIGFNPVKSSAAPAVDGQSVTVPAQPYPKSGLRQRLAAQGKTVPEVDNSLQSDIPARYYPPTSTALASDTGHAAIVALPDCNDRFPESWIKKLQDDGIGVLLISPNQAHPSQAYCTEGSLKAPKHGLTYWAFDALSALQYLTTQDEIDPNRIAVFGYGYGAGAAQLAIYRHGHAKHSKTQFKALIGLRPQCMSEMDNLAPSLLIGLKDDPFNPPAWCHWRLDRDLSPDLAPNREPVRFEVFESGETIEKQATRKLLSIESSPAIVAMVTNFLLESHVTEKNTQN